MVKAELDRDYYADLELQPSADANEIKKAFKRLALKYHPDRNPGRELEFNAKFQAIQSANEVLTDPQQRAKYDAQRIRSGYLHTYSNASPSPSRPPVPTRPPASNFPPPPRPPPPPMPKSNVPPPSGAQKYSNVRFNRSEASSPWSGSNTDDAKAKTSDYKAWEQMRTRHGQGPIPAGRTVPPKPPRASTFQPGYEQSSAKPAGSTSRRSGWDRWQEAQAGMPGISRSNTTRPSPKRTGFAPATPGGDEPQAAGSAYFKVSRGERPTTAGHQSQMPPPNAVPTAKKPDPLKAFRDQIGVNEPFGKKQPRTSSRHHRGTGEAANLKSPPHNLHRSATSAASHDNHRSTGFYDSKMANADAAHARATSTHSNHHSMSPPAKRPSKLPGMYSSSSSSSSSSDEEAASTSKKPSIPEIKTSHARASSGQRRPGFNLYAKVEDAGDEEMAPRANVGQSGIRRHSAIDLSSDKTPKGFQEHRMEHDAARSQPQSAGAPRSKGSNGAQPPLVRSHSWHDKYKYDYQKKQGSPPKGNVTHPSTGSDAANPTMYAIPEYTPFPCSPPSGPHSSGTPLSDKWSEQWPFKSPRMPKAVTAQAPPYWAIPSSLPPIKETGQRRSSAHHASHYDNTKASIANLEDLHSFTMPKYTGKAPDGAQPLRSHSSDNIDTKFSPEGYHPRFFEPFPASATSTPLRTVSPTMDSGSQPQWEAPDHIAEQDPTRGQDNFTTKPPTAMPPPPAAHDKYNPERWAHLNDIQLSVPQSPQARSPSRTSTRKRTWPRGTKFAAAQPKVNDVEDEPPSTDMNGESLNNSKIDNDVDAMDIDEPTAPLSSSNAPHTNGADFSPFQSNGGILNAHRAPALPPRQNAKGFHQSEKSNLHLGDLKDVFPLAPSNEGLGNMQDLAGDLPFESRPSAVKPGQDRTVQRFEFPQPPQYPTNPFSLTSSSCERHGQRIRDYMNEWNKFNSKMVSILTARKTFLHDNSESDIFDIQDKGFDDYMKGLQQLQRARIHYEIACEHHEKSMQDLSSLRQEMKRGRGPG